MRSEPSAPTEPPRVGLVRGFLRPLAATMKLTLQTLPVLNHLVPGGRPPVTRLYPYEKIELPASYRGQHVIDWYKCIGCELCAKVCPNECIYFEFLEVDDKSPYLHPSRAVMDQNKEVIRRPAVDVGHCLFCGNCSEYCPTDAWMFSQEFEHADYSREDLFYHAEELKKPDDECDRKTPLVNRIGEHPTLEADVCIGCRKCERECPTRCIDMVDGPNLRRGKAIVIPEFDYDKCIGCQQCVDVCPVDCLHMEEVGWPSGMGGFYNINFSGEVKLLEENEASIKAALASRPPQ